MADLLGKDEILFIHDGTAYLPIGCLTTSGISESREITEGTKTKCNTNPQGVPQDATYEGRFEAVANDDELTKMTHKKMRAEMKKDDPSYWKIERGGTPIEFGRAYLTALERSAPVDNVITWSGTLLGVGEISETDLITTTTTTTTV